MGITYAGESGAKKIARSRAYLTAATLVPAGVLGRASVFALAGHKAFDLDLIRAFGLTDNPNDILLADVNPVGLDEARRKWPGVRTFHGLAHMAPFGRRVDVVVADFCGHVDSDLSIRFFRSIRPFVGDGTVLIVTYLRGRERRDSFLERLRKSKKYKAAAGGENENGLHALRDFIVQSTIADCLGVQGRGGNKHMKSNRLILDYIESTSYTGHRSPMQICLFVLHKKYKAERLHASSREGRMKIIGKMSPPHLLAVADFYESFGIDGAAAMAVPRSTVAAWRAHQTMGTYVK